MGSELFGAKGWEGNRIDPLTYAILHGDEMHLLLGLDFPESVRELVGEEWWEQNQAVLREKANLGDVEEAADVELF